MALLGFGDDLTLAAIVEGGIDSAVTAGLSSAVYGSDFGSGFLSSFSSSVVTLATADFQALIGKQGLKEGGFEHAGLHALVGCVAAELSSANCASGAIGGIAQSIYAGNTGILERHINKDKHLANVEMVSALAAYFTSQGKSENVSIGARIGRSGFENNALCVGLCILAAIAAGYVLGTGEGDPIEGLRRIGRGEDLLSELAGLAGEEALAFATDNFPEQTAVVINAMIAAGEAANVVIQRTDEATGHVVSSTWNDIPQSTRDAIVGGTKVATFLIPAGSAGRILRRVPEVGPNRISLIDELTANGIKFTPENVVVIQKISNSRTVWLEIGNPDSGLEHIVSRHGDEFGQWGIRELDIPDFVIQALKDNNVVGTSGGVPVYLVGDVPTAVVVSSNGYIVTAYPVTTFERY